MYLHQPSNTVVYDLPDPSRVLKYVKEARSLHNGYVAVPASLYNLQLLRWIGLPVPPPMEKDYDWPGKYKPFEAQSVTANFLAVHPRAFVLSDMGTGKTLAALWAADYIMRQSLPHVCRALVVAPLSTLERVWADAVFQTFMGSRKGVVLHGSAEKRKRLLAQEADFYIVNYDGLRVIAKELAARTDIPMAIVDEASAYKDRTTHRHKLARQLLGPKNYLWLMTGTPTANGPLDAYGLAKLVNNCNGESYMSYRDRTMTRLSMFKWVPKQGAHVEAYKLMQPAVRFAIEDCVDLPEMSVQKRDVELSAEQAKAFKEMKRDLQLMIKEKQINAANEAVLRMKLIQISCGAVYGHSDSGGDVHRVVHHLDCSPRVSVLHEVIEQAREKIIVFAPLTSVLHMLHSELSKDYSCRIINGEVSQKERSEIFSAFQQEENPRILIADPGTMAHGLTLVAATTIIWYAPIDRTELYLQANKRIHRPGQTRACIVVQLSATAIEREIYRRLEANETMQGLILQMVKGEG